MFSRVMTGLRTKCIAIANFVHTYNHTPLHYITGIPMMLIEDDVAVAIKLCAIL